MGIINAALKYCSRISFFLSTERSLDGDVFGGLSPCYQTSKNQRLHTRQSTHHILSDLSPYSEICETFFLRSFHVLNRIVSKTLDQYWVRGKREVKIIFYFPENPDIIKLI